MDLVRFQSRPLMGIVRGVEADRIDALVECVIAAGLETLEITMNTPGAPELIARAQEIAGDRLCLGAGTVLSRDALDRALEAGARFVVMPTLVEEVAQACREREIPFFPGALTPQEIHAAWQSGAAMVKVFPARFFGPEYFREIKGPFEDVKLLACGGVSAATLADYARCGADAFAIGGSIFDRERVARGDFDAIAVELEAVIAALEAR